MNNRVAGIIVALSLLQGCAPSSHILVGQARPPIAASEVKIYSHAPLKFEEIAILNANSKSVFQPGGQNATDKVVELLKIEAAKLGANAIILEDFSDQQTGSLGTGLGSDSYSGHSSVGLGVGGSFGIFKKTGKARAIYIVPADAPPP